MATFPDLAAYEREVTGEPLVLPVRGREYSFTGHLSIALGITIARLREEVRRYTARALTGQPTDVDEDTVLLDDRREVDLYLELIGADNVQQMTTDGVSSAELQHIGFTVFTWHIAGPGQALAVWSQGQDTGAQIPPDQAADSSSRPPTTSPSSSPKSKRKPSAVKGSRGSAGRTSSTPGR